MDLAQLTQDLQTLADETAAGVAAARLNGMSYSVFINGLQNAGIEVDRKILADLAVHDAAAFSMLAEKAQAAIAKK